MYLHRAFDLTIASPFEISATRLEASAPQIDVSIVCQEYRGPYRASASQECVVTTAPGKIVMRWEEVGEFHLHGGRLIEIRHRPGISHELLNLFLSGSVFAMLLYQRGMNVLHGSVVGIDQQAVAFLAPKGFGKSTLAMAMHRLGAPLISDDIVALPSPSPVPRVTKGFIQAKLWPDSLAELGYTAHHHARLRDEVDKRGVTVTLGEHESLPLRHIFILGRGGDLTFLPLEKKYALMTLLPHWYLGRYGTATVAALGAIAQQFTQCLELVERVPISVLVRPTSLAELQHVAEATWEYVINAAVNAATDTAAASSVAAPAVATSPTTSPHLSIIETIL